MAATPGSNEDIERTRLHDLAYQTLRERMLIGSFQQGKSVTLRGLARRFELGFTPVREAVRRLIAERALEMRSNGRVGVPEMNSSKFGQIVFARCALEPELARRALAHVTDAALEEIEATNATMERARAAGDSEFYLRGNFEFHFSIYRLAQAETLLGLCESVWLQLGPFMRIAYGRSGTAEVKHRHAAICAALRARDPDLLCEAIRDDILDGMRATGERALQDASPAAKAGRKRRQKPS